MPTLGKRGIVGTVDIQPPPKELFVSKSLLSTQKSYHWKELMISSLQTTKFEKVPPDEEDWSEDDLIDYNIWS
jgi:hypothetical protein